MRFNYSQKLKLELTAAMRIRMAPINLTRIIAVSDRH